MPNIPPPILFVLALILMYCLPLYGQFAVPWWGLAFLLSIALVIALSAVVAFRQMRTTLSPLKPQDTCHLVTYGIFRFSRNPMYLSLVMILLVWWLWLGNLLAGFGLVGFVLYIHFVQIRFEERILRQKFGKDFSEYCRQTRAWF